MTEREYYEYYAEVDELMAFIILSRIGSDREVLYTWHGLMEKTILEWKLEWKNEDTG